MLGLTGKAASLKFDSVTYSQPKVFGGPNTLTLSEQQYFVWDTASQSTKPQDMLDIWGPWAPWPHWLRV